MQANLQSAFALLSLQSAELLNWEGGIILHPHPQGAMAAVFAGYWFDPSSLFAQMTVCLVGSEMAAPGNNQKREGGASSGLTVRKKLQTCKID